MRNVPFGLELVDFFADLFKLRSGDVLRKRNSSVRALVVRDVAFEVIVDTGPLFSDLSEGADRNAVAGLQFIPADSHGLFLKVFQTSPRVDS